MRSDSCLEIVMRTEQHFNNLPDRLCHSRPDDTSRTGRRANLFRISIFAKLQNILIMPQNRAIKCTYIRFGEENNLEYYKKCFLMHFVAINS